MTFKMGRHSADWRNIPAKILFSPLATGIGSESKQVTQKVYFRDGYYVLLKIHLHKFHYQAKENVEISCFMHDSVPLLCGIVFSCADYERIERQLENCFRYLTKGQFGLTASIIRSVFPHSQPCNSKLFGFSKIQVREHRFVSHSQKNHAGGWPLTECVFDTV